MEENVKKIEIIFRENYSNLVGNLYKWANYSSLLWQDVEDAVMESFRVILEYSTMEFEKKQKIFEENSYGFIYTIAKRKLIDKLRKNKTFKTKVTQEIVKKYSHYSPICLHKLNVDSLMDQLENKLSDCLLEILILHIKGYSRSEISEMLGKTISSVHTSICRARQKVQAILDGETMKTL